MEITLLISGDLAIDETNESKLQKIIAYGDSSQVTQNIFTNLYQLFGIGNVGDAELPVASITALSDLPDLVDISDQNLLRADPVILKADMTSLRLFDSQYFSLEKEAAQKIISKLNTFLREDGLQIGCGEDPQRWYLSMENRPDIETAVPGIVCGQDIGEFLPEGIDRQFWRRLMNEIQMFLYDVSNREGKEDIPVNSVWFWGNGKLPQSTTCQFDVVISNDVNAKGLAQWAGVPNYSISENFQQSLENKNKDDNILIVLSPGDLALSKPDQAQQVKWLKEWDEVVFGLLLEMLKKRTVKKLKITSSDLQCTVKPGHLLRFWRNKRVRN